MLGGERGIILGLELAGGGCHIVENSWLLIFLKGGEKISFCREKFFFSPNEQGLVFIQTLLGSQPLFRVAIPIACIASDTST